MNMPDPQAFAATWMTQLTDPSAWQGWLKMPATDLGAGMANPLAGNPLAGILKDFKVGIAPARLTTVGHGENRPVASNDDEAGRARNRRVAVTVIAAVPENAVPAMPG